MADIDHFPSQCGMKIIHNLGTFDSLSNQIERLDWVFNGLGCCQAVLSDTVSKEKDRWAETKANAYHGPARKNPNSNNRIKVYICTRETLAALRRLQKQQQKQEIT